VITYRSSFNRSYPVFTFLLSFLLFFASPGTANTAATLSPALARPAGSVEPCKIFGSVYLENDPRRANSCFAVVYVEPEQAFADVLVFNETNKLFADKAGLWCPAENREFADYALFVTTDRSRADFAIHYTKVRSFAGCKQ